MRTKNPTKRNVFLFLVGCLILPAVSAMGFDVGFEGSEDLIVEQNTTLQLPADGVLKYRNVHVQTGATLKFGKNEDNTPVGLLASGDVIFDGTVTVSASGRGAGPGGYNGGYGGPKTRVGRRGEGPGGADGGKEVTSANYGYTGGHGGGFATDGGQYRTTFYGFPGKNYGNQRCVPLLGGSGGGGGGGVSSYVGGDGGGGGGGILIGASGTITVKGTIVANGATGSRAPDYADGYYSSDPCYSGGAGGGGSGGAIRLISNMITGNGAIQAIGGGGNWLIYRRDTSYSDTCGRELSAGGAPGRILLEADTISQNIATSPQAAFGPPVALYPADVPSLSIVAIGGVGVPQGARGDMESPDIWLPYNTTNPVTIQVQTLNIPSGATVTVKAQPVEGSITSASKSLSGNTVSIGINLSTQFPSVITAYATYQVTAALGAPLFADGERVAQVRVETVLGGGSKVIYITESGREVAQI